jgi:hypothetical protein
LREFEEPYSDIWQLRLPENKDAFEEAQPAYDIHASVDVGFEAVVAPGRAASWVVVSCESPET